jgi:hypothetical protein
MLSMASEHVTQVKDLILSHGQEKDGIVSCYQDLKMLKVSK